jgi:molybdenum cofactor cytidylyltransferase
MSGVPAILLAAGRGTRFGEEPKLLARIGGKALVRHAAEAAAHSTAGPVIVVTGYRADLVETELKGLPVQIVHNPQYSDGLSTSLKAGFSALPPEARAAIVLLGDMPFVRSELIDALIAGWQGRGEPAALIPVLNGQRGNPVVLSRTLQTAIEGLSGDVGAGAILRGKPDVVEWQTRDSAIIHDIDSREEFAKHQS